MSRRRPRRQQRGTIPTRRELGWPALFLALIVALTIGSLLQDAVGFPYGLVGGLVWSGVLGATFVFGLLYYARFVLPPGERDSWFEGGRMIGRHYLLRGNLFLQQLGPTVAKKEEESPLPLSFKKLRAGMVASHNALAIARGNSFARAVGPGFVMLYRGENIKEIIDLRPQVRSQTVTVNTRDGIPVETTVSVVFQIRRYELDHENGQQPYSYDREAIFHVTYMHSINEGEIPRPWAEQICPPIATLVIEELARHMLDDLYSVEGDLLPLSEIAQTIQQQEQGRLAAGGIDLLGVSIGHLQLPDPVREQRIHSWRAGWEQRIKVQEGMGKAEALRRLKQARARAQIDIITNVLEGIETMRYVEDANLSEIIMLRMIKVLEEAAQDKTMRQMFPEQIVSNLALDTSNQMRQLLEGPKPATEETAA